MGGTAITLVTKRERVPRFAGRWIYCGDDYLDMLRWERALPGCERISYADRLSGTFRRLRPDLIRWTAGLGAPYGASLAWWMSALAGKNVMSTSIFVHICYLDVLSQIVRERPDDRLLIVCEHEYLLAAIRRMLHAAGRQAVRTAGWRASFAAYALSEAARIAYRWIKWIGAQAGRLAAARLTRSLRRDAVPGVAAKQVLMHTCIDDACLAADGTFSDRYFCGLADWLRGRGYQVTLLPWVYNTRRNVFWILRWLRSSRESFLLPEDYLRAADYFECARQLVRAGCILKGEHRFGDFDVTPLVLRERLIVTSPSLHMQFLLYGPALARWIAQGHACDVFIDTFENAPPERPQIASLRKCSPRTLLIGYQHGATSLREFLPYAIEPDEWQRGLFPDRIVCSGEFTAGLLVQGGFPRSHVVAGPAVRYRHLIEPPPAGAEEREGRPEGASPRRILVLLPLELAGAVELVHRLLAIREFFAQRALGLAVRAHPMTDRAVLLRYCGLNGLPAGWTWSDALLAAELARAQIVIAAATNAQVDAAASGVPVICVRRELGFDYNFLDYWCDDYPICRSVAPEELTGRLTQILEDRDGGLHAQARKLAAAIVAGLGKLDDAHFSAFV